MAESPIAFYNGLDKHLRSHGRRRSFSDPCHFRKQHIDVGFHVDDGVYTGSPAAITDFENHMKLYYELKMLDPAAHSLAYDVSRQQKAYTFTKYHTLNTL